MKTLKEITARMLEIEQANMNYNRLTNFGNNPNGQENEIQKMLNEWDILKAERLKLKQPKN